jgi:uncharacterized protein YndB with AHSA1/START domain
MNNSPRKVIDLALTSAAPLDRIWAAWTDPRHLVNWYCDRAEGLVEPGGALVEHWDWFHLSFSRPVTAVDPMRRLVLGTVTLDFRAASTRRAVRLTDTGCPQDPVGFQAVRSGWLNALALLKEYTERHWDRPKQAFTDLREAEFDFSRVITLFRAPYREQWLPFAAAVLQDTGSEVVLDWPEIEGALELKAFPWTEGKRMLGLRAVSWSERDLANRTAELRAAVDRLLGLLS